MSTLRVNSISDIAGTGSPNITQQCKAWVNFNGTGAVAIRAQYNVSSITDRGVGQYTVNFTNAMPDANYAVALTKGNLNNATNAGEYYLSSSTASGALVNTYENGVVADIVSISVAIFR